MSTGSLSHDFAQPALDEVYKAPESRLLLAVLQDALATFQRGLNTSAGKERQMFREVDYWFRSRSYDSPFSFESICDALDLHPSYVRRNLSLPNGDGWKIRQRIGRVDRRRGATLREPSASRGQPPLQRSLRALQADGQSER